MEPYIDASTSLSLISNGMVEIYVIYSNWYLRKEEEQFFFVLYDREEKNP